MGNSYQVKPWHGFIVATLILVMGLGVGLSQKTAAVASPEAFGGGTRDSARDAAEHENLPAEPVGESGGVRSVEGGAGDFSRGIDLGPNIPTETPGVSNPVPKFSGLVTPWLLNAGGPLEFTDDSISHGLMDVRGGLINNDPTAISLAGGGAPPPAPTPGPSPTPAPPAQPDLVAELPNHSPAILTTASSISFTATIKNQGTASTESGFRSKLHLDWENDGTIDVPIMVIHAAPLAGNNATTEATFTGVVSGVSVGTHSYRICADDGSPTPVAESNEANNCTETHTFTVSAAPPPPPAPPTVILTVGSSSISETGGTTAITATLSAASAQTVTVMLGKSGTASDTTDYTLAGTIVIPANTRSGSVPLSAVSDTFNELNETVVINVSTVTNGTESGTQQRTVTINDDDPAPAPAPAPQAPVLEFDSPTYTLSSTGDVVATIKFTGTDPQPGVVNTLNVKVSSGADPAGFLIQLTETGGGSTGILQNTVNLNFNVAVSNAGKRELKVDACNSDLIRVEADATVYDTAIVGSQTLCLSRTGTTTAPFTAGSQEILKFKAKTGVPPSQTLSVTRFFVRFFTANSSKTATTAAKFTNFKLRNATTGIPISDSEATLTFHNFPDNPDRGQIWVLNRSAGIGINNTEQTYSIVADIACENGTQADFMIERNVDDVISSGPSFVRVLRDFSQPLRAMPACPSPPPTATLTNTTPVIPANSVILTWTTTNATSASIDQGIGAVPVAAGTLTINRPTTTTTYTLTATNAAGQTVTATTTVTVTPPTGRGTPWPRQATKAINSVLHSPVINLGVSDFGANSVLGAIPAAQAAPINERSLNIFDADRTSAAGGGPAGVTVQDITLYNPVTIHDDLWVRGSGNPAREPGNLVVTGLIQSTGNIQTTANLQGARLNVGAGLELGTTTTQHQITGNLQINPGDGGVDIAGGDLSVTGGSITADSIGRFYRVDNTISDATASKTVPAACAASDILVSCNGGFIGTLTSTNFHGTEMTTNTTCTVRGSQTGAVAKTLKAQAVCFSPDGSASIPAGATQLP